MEQSSLWYLLPQKISSIPFHFIKFNDSNNKRLLNTEQVFSTMLSDFTCVNSFNSPKSHRKYCYL